MQNIRACHAHAEQIYTRIYQSKRRQRQRERVRSKLDKAITHEFRVRFEVGFVKFIRFCFEIQKRTPPPVVEKKSSQGFIAPGAWSRVRCHRFHAPSLLEVRCWFGVRFPVERLSIKRKKKKGRAAKEERGRGRDSGRTKKKLDAEGSLTGREGVGSVLAVLPVICQESIVGETFLHPERVGENGRTFAIPPTIPRAQDERRCLLKAFDRFFMAPQSGQTLARRFYRRFSFLSDRRVASAAFPFSCFRRNRARGSVWFRNIHHVNGGNTDGGA